MDPLLGIAEELERRDAQAAAALVDVEELQRDVEELRTRAGATNEFLVTLPMRLAERESDEQAATAARAEASEALRDAEALLERARKEDERLAAARAVQHAQDALRAAELWLTQAHDARVALERAGEEQREEAARVERRAAALAPRLPEVDPPAPGLDATLAWASRARADLILSRAGLATERDKVVREASELVASVLGEPLAATSVAGVRERLARALEQQ